MHQQVKIEKTPDQGRSRLSATGKRYFSLIEFDDEEQLLLEIRKHVFGLFIIIITGALISLAVLFASFIVASGNIVGLLGFEGAEKFIALIGFVLSVLIAGVTLIYAQLYRSNVVYVTNEKVAQVLYITLFNRKISQLNIGDVQDVTVTQKGIFAHLFGYGTLVIETAGEQQNYTFSFVPNPYAVSKVIIVAHEGNLKLYGN